MKINLIRKGAYQQISGFMLAETMVAFGIAGIAIVSLYAGISQSFASVRAAREEQRATQILAERLEALRLITWDQLNTPGFVPSDFRESFLERNDNPLYPTVTSKRLSEDTGTILANTREVGIVYVGRVEIDQQRVPAVYGDHMRRVNMTVTWRSGQHVRQRNMETFVSEYGVQNYIY